MLYHNPCLLYSSSSSLKAKAHGLSFSIFSIFLYQIFNQVARFFGSLIFHWSKVIHNNIQISTCMQEIVVSWYDVPPVNALRVWTCQKPRAHNLCRPPTLSTLVSLSSPTLPDLLQPSLHWWFSISPNLSIYL